MALAKALILIACLLVGVLLGITTEVVVNRHKSASQSQGLKTEKPVAKKSSAHNAKSVPPQPLNFDVNQAISHVTYLAQTIGLREEGTSDENRAAEYIQQRLAEFGYKPIVQLIPITTTQRTSRNVIAKLDGRTSPQQTIVVGAHMDSKGGPGANDNATGCAVLLELARVLKNNNRQIPTIEFVFFGGEEIAQGGGSNDHHWGSRYFVNALTPVERAGIAGMISVDMIGTGPEFRARNMGLAPKTLVDFMLELGGTSGMSYLRDSSSVGNSDHEPFEKAGFTSVWLEYRDFPQYHTPGDTVSTVDFSHVQTVGRLLQDFFEQYLSPDRMNLLPSRQ